MPLPVPAPAPAPGAAEPPRPPDLTALAYDFLLVAIPALEQYAASLANAGGEPVPPLTLEPPADPVITKLWRFFPLEMDEILRLKYLRSTELGYDIGLSRAIKEWLQMHHAL